MIKLKGSVAVIKFFMVVVCLGCWPYLESVASNREEDESLRLKAIVDIIKNEKNLVFSKYQALDTDRKHEAYCAVKMSELIDGKNYTALEPIIVYGSGLVNSEATSRGVNSEDRVLSEKVFQTFSDCELADAGGDEDRARRMFLGFSDLSGLPPYRIYEVPQKINPMTPFSYIFWSEYNKKIGVGRKGYSWIDLEKCEYKKTIGVMSDSLNLERDPLGQVAALAIYQNGKLSNPSLSVWKVVRGSRVELESYESNGVGQDPSRSISCAWDVVH